MTLIAKHLSGLSSPSTLPLDSTQIDENSIYLNCGEPDFISPKVIGEEACHAIYTNFTNYTLVEGTLQLRESISRKLKRENQLDYDPSQIIVSNGAKQVIYNALLASLNPEDEVIIPAPYWVSYPTMVTIARGCSRIVPCEETANFKISPEDLEGVINDSTKWLILNSPNNPTGAIYEKGELEELACVLRQYPHVNILSDDVYEHIRFLKTPPINIAQVSPDLRDRIILVNSVSKTYSMTGWRIGYGVTYNKNLLNTMVAIQAHSTANTCSISQVAASKALDGGVAFLKDIVNSYREKKDYLVNTINRISGLQCSDPQGGIYIYVKCKELLGKKTRNGNLISTDSDLVGYISDTTKVYLTAGKEFGMSPYIRISFAVSFKVLEEAVFRIKEACKKLG